MELNHDDDDDDDEAALIFVSRTGGTNESESQLELCLLGRRRDIQTEIQS